MGVGVGGDRDRILSYMNLCDCVCVCVRVCYKARMTQYVSVFVYAFKVTPQRALLS